jgi:curved DNA-binding protein CbpA
MKSLRDVPLSPTDGFVLSRIDGASDEQQLVALTGLSDQEVRSSLAKLELLGVVTFDMPTSPANVGVSPPAPPSAPRMPGSPLPSDPDLTVREEVDLDPETRRRVFEMHSRLDSIDHYELLGVDHAADKKALRRAYFGLAAKFHPDRYFRKKLGSFKPRMEAIFGRLTLAHETLSDGDRRAEYDAYLDEQRQALGIERLLADAASEATRAEESIEREVRAQASLDATSSVAAGSDPQKLVPTGPAAPLPVVGIAARRDAFARRLLGGSGRSHGASTAPPPSSSITPPVTPSVADAMNSLRHRYEERISRAKSAQARKYVATAEAAMAQGDTVSAANAFRVAQKLSPADAELQRKAKEAQQKADAVLSEMYARQGAYEEKNGQWAEAARSWSRVTRARPNDADAHAHAADALVKASGDLHEARRLAVTACTLNPESPQYRVTLANVYLSAGLPQNARRELETAAQLAPHDDTIRAMMNSIGSRG